MFTLVRELCSMYSFSYFMQSILRNLGFLATFNTHIPDPDFQRLVTNKIGIHLIWV